MAYAVAVQPPSLKAMLCLPKHIQQRIVEKLEDLEVNPRPSGIKALKGQIPGYRLRVGNYRVLYTVDDKNRTVTVYEIGHRKDVYR